MIDLAGLYKKPGESGAVVPAASSAPDMAQALAQVLGKALAPAPAPEESAEKKELAIQIPPGLPQAYIDVNLQEQPVPQPLSDDIAQDQAKPLAHQLFPGVVTMCQRDSVPYRPGPESAVVQERIAQGPHAFVSRAQKDAFERGRDEEKARKEPRAPTLPQADTSKAGVYVKGESAPYRPGA